MLIPVHVPKPLHLPVSRRRPVAVLLLDGSASMAKGEPRRIDMLWMAVQALRTPDATWKAAIFSDGFAWSALKYCPEPDGNTDLALAFREVGKVPITQITLVTDGEPNDTADAQVAGLALRVPISILYVGDAHNEEAIRFCRDLCQHTGGTFATEVLTLTSSARVAQTLQKMLGSGTSAQSAIVLGG